MEEEIKFINQPLTDDDYDVLSGMLIIFIKSARRIIQIVESGKAIDYKNSQDYKAYVKLYGKKKVDELVEQQVIRIVEGDSKLRLGKLLRLAQDFYNTSEGLLDEGMRAHTKDVNDAQAFDAIQHDANFLTYAYALMANCPNDDDEIKLLSTIKMLAKGHRVSERVLERLEYHN